MDFHGALLRVDTLTKENEELKVEIASLRAAKVGHENKIIEKLKEQNKAAVQTIQDREKTIMDLRDKAMKANFKFAAIRETLDE